MSLLNTIIVTQPSFFYHMGDRYRKGMPPEHLKWIYPLQSFGNHGVMTVLSSDSPMVPSDPFTGIYTVVTRKDQFALTFSPEESVSTIDALRMYSLFPAFASFEENRKGSITSGKLADMALLSDDPTQVEPEEIKNIKNLLTIIDGKVVWEA